jgi:hypothetical protein
MVVPVKVRPCHNKLVVQVGERTRQGSVNGRKKERAYRLRETLIAITAYRKLRRGLKSPLAAPTVGLLSLTAEARFVFLLDNRHSAGIRPPRVRRTFYSRRAHRTSASKRTAFAALRRSYCRDCRIAEPQTWQRVRPDRQGRPCLHQQAEQCMPPASSFSLCTHHEPWRVLRSTIIPPGADGSKEIHSRCSSCRGIRERKARHVET